MMPVLLKNMCVHGRSMVYPALVSARFKLSTTQFLFMAGQPRIYSTFSLKKNALKKEESEIMLPNPCKLQPILFQSFHSSGPQYKQIDKDLIQGKLNEIKHLFLKDVKEIKTASGPAMMFSGAVVAPFILMPVLVSNTGLAELAYGACMLSFFGGLRWGTTLSKPDDKLLGFTFGPALIGWLGLILPQTLGGFVIVSGLLSSAYFDLKTAGYPPWLKGLRSLVAVIGGSMILLTTIL